MNFLTLIDYIGTFAFAISGIRLASAKRFDWFGAYVVGFVTAVGGGTIRDLLLDVTPFWMLQSSYLIVLTHLYIDPSNHDFARNYLCDFFVFSDFLKFQSLGISRAFSLVVHCSIFKILSKQLSCCNFYIISHSEVFVK